MKALSEDRSKARGSEVIKHSEVGGPKANRTSEAYPEEVSSEETHDGSQKATQSKKTFKFKSSHPEDKIIGNKDRPLKTRSTFREEHSMI